MAQWAKVVREFGKKVEYGAWAGERGPSKNLDQRTGDFSLTCENRFSFFAESVNRFLVIGTVIGQCLVGDRRIHYGIGENSQRNVDTGLRPANGLRGTEDEAVGEVPHLGVELICGYRVIDQADALGFTSR